MGVIPVFRYLTILLVVNHTLYALIPSRPAKPQLPVEIIPSCTQLREVIQWSAGHYGGGVAIDLNATAFLAKIPTLLAEKLDPRHLLFLSSEVNQLEIGHAQAWNLFVKQGKCDFYERWVAEQVPKSKARLLSLLTSLNLKNIKAVIASDDDSHASIPFAMTSGELTQRLTEHVARVLGEATPQLLKAYGGSRTLFVEDNLRQIIAQETDRLAQAPRNLIAKAAIGAMDKYSTFFSNAEYIDFHEDLSAGTTGVGVRLRKVPRGLMVEGLVPGAPAEMSKRLRVGDTINAVDGIAVDEIPFGESRKLFRGTPSSLVTLRVMRGSNAASEDVILTRAPFLFSDETVTASRAAENPAVLIIDVPSFYAASDPSVKASSSHDLRNSLMAELSKKARPEAIVLDVRGNPGGYLEEAVQMAGLFIGERPVVSVVEREGIKTLSDIGAKVMFDGPIVLLQDAESASAAEILSGALRDYERAVIVGSPSSYGKGSVQRLFNLDGEGPIPVPGVVKLTTSVFYTPLGHTPANGGIRSDIAITNATPPDGRSLKYPDHHPKIEKSLIARIKKDRVRMDAIRQSLIQLRTSRGAVHAGEHERDVELAEAVRVINDWLAFERSESFETGSQLRRNVVGY